MRVDKRVKWIKDRENKDRKREGVSERDERGEGER